ncbi:hypothetical protein ACFGOO_06365 [Treponema vincentii]|uniref:hypothetical protein n=1 Tax=Treponema vincentii TaxID=69710 RepID=UPI0035F5A9D5
MKIYEQFGEHDLDDLILWLKERDGAELIKDDIEKLYHALYYFEAEQTESFYSKLNPSSAKDGASVSAAEFEVFFKNLALLYPLSKHILLKIVHTHPLNKDNILTGRFFDVYAMDEGLSAAYKDTVLAVKDGLKGIPSRIREIDDAIAIHEKTMESSQAKRKELQVKIKEADEKAEKENTLYQEIQKLQNEVNELKTKYSKEHLDEQRQKLQIEKANLETNKKQYEDLSQQIAAINKEIDRYSKDVCKENLAELSKKSKSLPENEEI